MSWHLFWLLARSGGQREAREQLRWTYAVAQGIGVAFGASGARTIEMLRRRAFPAAAARRPDLLVNRAAGTDGH
jgi:hypothetical protein